MNFFNSQATKISQFPILFCSFLAVCLLCARGELHAATYNVGSGQAYTTIASVPTLQPGDVVNIQCGTYNEVRQWLSNGTAANPIILQGVCSTGRPVIDGNGLDTSGSGSVPRGVWEIQGSYYLVQNLEFKNAHNGDNAAGIRVMNANVTINNCLIDNNDMGIMTSTFNVDNFVVQNTEIAYNGTGWQDGESHNVYLTTGATVTFQYCYIHDSVSGENFKSRAHYTQLFYNYIAFGAESEVEGLDYTDTVDPNSNMTLIGNLLVSTPNRTINDVKFINFGQDEGGTHNGTLYLINNTLIAGAGTISFLRSSATNSSIVAVNNVFYGSNNIVQAGIATNITGNNNWFPSTAIMPPGFTNTVTGNNPAFLNQSLLDFDLTAASTARNIGAPNPTYLDGTGVSHSGIPTLEYLQPLRSVTRPLDSGLDAGAYGYALVASGVPDLTVTKQHAGIFFQGESGTYTITVTNSGSAPTNSAVTVTDTLPSGLTASAISGSGWSCTLSPLSCSRNDAIGAGGVYPTISVVVTIAANSPFSVTNTATVSGGGETNTGNDSVSDITTISPISAASGTAAFVSTDIHTEGTWKGVYGGDGASVIGDTANYPSYVTVTPSASASTFVWASSSTDPRALQKISSTTDRIAACWYTSTSFTIDLNFKDTNSHQVALYLLDWDNYNGRAERIDILDANGNSLDSRNAASFVSGAYMIWNLTGHVVIRVTNSNPNSNAVVNGLFFGLAPTATSTGTASFVATDTATAGSWKAVYGGDGANVIGNAASYPSYVTVTPTANSTFIWASSTTDPRAPQLESSTSGRIAACWYSAGSFSIDLNFTDGGTHLTALYLLDWDNYYSRTERVDILDSNGNLLDTRSAANFVAGQYLVWKLAGHVVVRVTNTNAPSNAVVSGLFFGPATASATTATFIKTDTSTAGAWRGVYGADGVNVLGDTAVYPAYATVTPAANNFFLWASSTTDPRALQLESASSGRVAACWFSATSFSIDVKLSDGNAHQLALYLLDWDNYFGRSERIDILDSTGNVLDTRSVANFVAGEYLVWNVAGHVVIRVSNTNGSSNAVVNGLFFR